jgi:hypothetical protein
MMRFNVITTFKNVDQDIIDIDLPTSYYSEEEKFVKTIFDCLNKEDIRELVKFSICQFANNQTEALKWLDQRDGKIYFNYYENDVDDTRRWHNFRIDYLQDRVRE